MLPAREHGIQRRLANKLANKDAMRGPALQTPSIRRQPRANRKVKASHESGLTDVTP